MRFRSRAAAPDPALRGPRTTAWPMFFAALFGAASVFSFAPFGWWPVQFVSLAFLFYQVGMDTRVKRSTLIGLAFGFGWSVANIHWLYVSMHVYGGMHGALAVAALCVLGLYMGAWSALAMGMATWLRKRWALPVKSFLLLVLPIAWATGEWLRGTVLTGFPWSASGYAHNAAPLGGYAALIGVYGIGLLAALCGACLAMITQRARWFGLGLLAAILAAGYGLRQVAWTHPQGQPMSVRLLQGNVPQNEKFDERHVMGALALYQKMITEQRADLVAAPETAIVLFPKFLPPDYLPQLAAWAKASDSALLFGIPLEDKPGDFAVSVAGISPQGASYRYDKHHLVPFGEYVLTGFRWFVDMMHIPLGEATRGAAVQAPFAVKDQLVLPNICYEDAFGEEIALQLRATDKPATMLLNGSNLAWFGETVAIPQHLQISQMRSLETGRPMLRTTNTGATAVIDGRGALQAQLPLYQRGTLAATVQGMGGMTPYIRMGNALFFALAALGLGAAWNAGRIYRKKSP
ncbi:MAG: apolipoprotein N-acyltransferase [Pseudomonadota bacterium]